VKSPHRRLKALLVGGAVLLILLAAAGGVLLYGRTQLEPVSSSHDRQALVTVAPGESLDQLVNDLAARHLVRSSFWFGWYARFRGLGGRLHPGQFRLDSGMGASAIVAKLEGSPDVAVRRVALAEGLTAAEMAVKIEAATGIKAEDYLQQVRSGEFSGPFLAGRPQGASLEGFLFPDTYDVPEGTSAHALVQMQLDAFKRKAAQLLSASSPALSPYQLLIVASIVEGEARFAEDRPLVASVVDNRLAAHMTLDVDSSVMYGLGRPGQAPSAADLQQDTPYNTYLHAGLPPTPTANPGTAAIEAAVHPATTGYLYFVSDGCGHNHYSMTSAEHDQQVSQFLGKPCPA